MGFKSNFLPGKQFICSGLTAAAAGAQFLGFYGVCYAINLMVLEKGTVAFYFRVGDFKFNFRATRTNNGFQK